MRITGAGLHVFPRILRRAADIDRKPPAKRLSTGIAALDEMLGGGIPAWDSMLVTGPAGSGRSALATQFVDAGLAVGEPAVIAVFEEHPKEFLAHAKSMATTASRLRLSRATVSRCESTRFTRAWRQSCA
jgi:circadian clock protein KaiC